jgi:hypothetical protein
MRKVNQKTGHRQRSNQQGGDKPPQAWRYPGLERRELRNRRILFRIRELWRQQASLLLSSVLFHAEKGGSVVAGGYQNSDRTIGTRSLIDLLQAFAKGVSNDPDYCVRLGIEIVAPAQSFDRDQMLANLVILTQEVLHADI